MMSEAYARSFGVPVVTLRPFNTFGPRQSERAIVPTLIRQVLDPDCTEIMVGDTSPVRDLTFVEDTAAAFLAAGSASLEYGSAYNAGSQRAVTIAELLDHILKLSKCEKPVRVDKCRLRPQNSEVRALLADSSRFERETGWKAHTTLQEGLSRTITWWRNRLGEGRVRREKNYMI
jgi:nucleoside-diphosphate-sugar epimerase